MKGGKGTIIAGGLVAIAGVAAAAAPYGLGVSVENELRRTADRAAASPYVEAWEVTGYERGYAAATAASRITLVLPGTDDTVELTVDHAITHGPYATGGDLGRVHSTVRVTGGPIASALERMYRRRAPLTVDHAISAGGRMTAELVSPAPEHAWQGDGGTVSWLGMEGRIVAQDGGSALSYDITIDGLELEARDDAGRGGIRGIELSGDQRRHESADVWVGESTATIGRIGFDEGDASFGLRDVEVRSSAAIDDGLLQFDTAVEVPEMRVPRYPSVRDLRVRFAAERLAPAFVRDMQALATEMEQAGTEAEKQRIARRAMQSLDWQSFARTNPRIRIEPLRLGAAEGAFDASLRAELSGVGEDTRVASPFQLMRYAKAEASVRTPTALLHALLAERRAAASGTSEAAARAQAEQRVAGLAERGLLVLEDGQATLEASIDRGSIRINGRSLAQLMR